MRNILPNSCIEALYDEIPITQYQPLSKPCSDLALCQVLARLLVPVYVRLVQRFRMGLHARNHVTQLVRGLVRNFTG
jgi:hypothetical protein